jgi:hypothetical protein
LFGNISVIRCAEFAYLVFHRLVIEAAVPRYTGRRALREKLAKLKLHCILRYFDLPMCPNANSTRCD